MFVNCPFFPLRFSHYYALITQTYCTTRYNCENKICKFLSKIHKKSWFFILFFEKIFLFQVVILKIVDFLYMFFCNIRLWKRPRHGLKIVYTVHKTWKKRIFSYLKSMKSNCSSRKSGTRLMGHPLQHTHVAFSFLP